MDLHEQIRELREKTTRTRSQFLRAELQTCSMALEMVRYQLAIGNLEIAARELDCVALGIKTIERFLPETSKELRSEVEAKLMVLRALLKPLQIELEAATVGRESRTS